jgi:hypothetical protein
MSWSRPPSHIAAIIAAAILIFFFKVDRFDLQWLTGPFDTRAFANYTPYYPGMTDLGNHEIFSPKYAGKKKIVLLGPSSVDSIGCDYTWSAPTSKEQVRNAHYSCSIAGQMNELLKAAGLTDWRAFDLARNGAKLTPMLYTYARIHALKPEIVIYGATIPYYAQDHADGPNMKWAQMTYLDSIFGTKPNLASLWDRYKAALGPVQRWQPPEGTAAPSFADTLPVFREKTTLSDLLTRAFSFIRQAKWVEGPPQPISYNTATKAFDAQMRFDSKAAEALDPKLDLFSGFGLIEGLQRADNHSFLLYHSPSFRYREDKDFIAMLSTGKYAAVLNKLGVPFEVYVDLPLKPVYETYDGFHQTRAGNRIIAERLLADLKRRQMM